MKIKAKLLLWITVVLIVTISSISIVIIATTVSSSKQDIADYRVEQTRKYKESLKAYVDIAYATVKSQYEASHNNNALIKRYGPNLSRIIDISESIINRNIALYKTGKMTLAEAQALSKQQIKNVRYDNGNGYVWINDTTLPYPRMIMHPTVPSLDGKVLSDPKYNVALGKGKNLFAAGVEMCLQNGDGFVDYKWPKPGSTGDQPKLSYVRLIKEWNWVIGTGIYIDDAEKEAKEYSKEVVKSMLYNGGSGYFWINDTTLPYPRMVMHSKIPSLDGKVLNNPKYNVAFGKDKNLFAAGVEICNKDGEGFIEYKWPKEGFTEDQPKLSFVKLFPEWGWIIGTGVYIDEIERTVQQKTDAILKATRRMIFLILIISAVIFVVSFVVSYIFANSLSRPLAKITEDAGRIAAGDLEIEEPDKIGKDEIGTLNIAFSKMIKNLRYKEEAVTRMAGGDFSVDIDVASDRDALGHAIVKMTDSLNNLLSQVNMSVDQVNLGADQVSQASQSLSQGATEQAASLEEIAASVTEINSQSRKNAENATEANNIAKKAAEDAETGNRQMAELSDAMARINESSDQIKKIVKVIDDIAFQTNLLALNANVEAARAGKYGKGFAVVADEVRNLAVRSAEAVKETTEMVDDSIKNIESGNNAVEATAGQLESIMEGSSKVADYLEEIAAASKEQAEGIEQITQGLGQIDEVTQSNTASAEESAAASEELASQSVHLKKMIAAFKLKETKKLYSAGQQRKEISIPDTAASTPDKDVDPASVIALDDDDFGTF